MIAQNYFWHYAVVMGENGTDDLSYEDYVAEDYAGGTDSSRYYNDDGYDPEASALPDQLTDLDFKDYSQEFNGSNNLVDGYSVTGDNTEARGDTETATSSYGSDSSSVVESDNFDGGAGTEKEEPDNYDGEEDEESVDEDSDDVEDDDENDEDGEFVDNKGSEQNRNEQQVEGKKRKDYEGVINWKPGEKITIELLGQIWDKCRVIDKIRSLIDAANNAVSQAMNALGPNLMLRLNAFVNKMIDATKDTISSLLDLASRTGKRMVYLTASTVEAIFDQQWTQTATIATLPTVLKMTLETDMVKSILNRIFKIAVPIINRAARKNN